MSWSDDDYYRFLGKALFEWTELHFELALYAARIHGELNGGLDQFVLMNAKSLRMKASVKPDTGIALHRELTKRYTAAAMRRDDISHSFPMQVSSTPTGRASKVLARYRRANNDSAATRDEDLTPEWLCKFADDCKELRRDIGRFHHDTLGSVADFWISEQAGRPE